VAGGTLDATGMAIRAVLQAVSLSVDPGDSVSGDVRVVNDGPDEVRVVLTVTGPGRPYSWVTPDALTVGAGSEATARMGFNVPRASVPAAGPLPFTLRVTLAGESAPAASVDGVVDVRPFAILSATLSDPVERGATSVRHELTVANRGNGPTETALRGESDDAQVEVRVTPPSLVVTPGTKASAAVDVTAGKRRLAGRPRTSTFRVVADPEVGTAVTVEERLRQKPLLPRSAVAVAAVVGAVALVGGVLAVTVGREDPAPAARGGTGPAATGAGTSAGGSKLDPCPAQGHGDAFGVRGLTESEIAKLPETYTFLHVLPDGCTPSRFNPCEPIHYVQNAADAPPDVVVNVREAFRRLSEATGMTFVDDGLTDETARTRPYIPERYGARWAPILIVWEHFPAEQTTGRSQILGNTFVYREQGVVVSARLRFNVDAYNDEFTKAPIQAGFGPPSGSGTGPIGRENITWGRIVLHELAHVVGLGHTRNLASLMYPDAAQQTTRPAGFHRDDFEGLRYLGREAGCLTTPPVPAA
jgi:hypothetical protein